MKRNSVLAVLVLVSLLLTSCGGVSIDNYNAVSKERDELLIQKANLEAEYLDILEERDQLLRRYETVPATISGQFTATVRATLPDYGVDGAHRYAVVTLFQGAPFTIYLGSELTSQVEIGETYVFELEEKTIELQRHQLETIPPWPEAAIPMYELSISSICTPTEDELGMNCYQLEYKPAE